MVIEHLGTFNPASKCRANTDWGWSALHPHMRGACMAPARAPAGVPARVAGVSDSRAAAGANKDAGILLRHRPRLPHEHAGILSLSSRVSGFDAARRRSAAMHPRLPPSRPAFPDPGHRLCS